MIKTPLIAGFAALALGISAPVDVLADDYPNRPVRLLVGYSAGGTADVVARLLARDMSEALGQPVVVENKPGANGLIATNDLIRAKPDGYTILMASLSHAVNPILNPSQAAYNPITDITPVSLVATLPLVLTAAYDSPYAGVKELLAQAKAKPGTINYGSAGIGGSGHLAGAMLAQNSGTEMTHIPFKGNAPALNEVIAGRLSFMFYPTIGIEGQAQQKRVKVLAVGTEKRMDKFPDVPTLAEEGFEGFEETAIWLGVMAPAGTPKSIVDRLHGAIAAAMVKPAIKESLVSMGTIVVGSSPSEFAQFIKADNDRWTKVISAAGITASN